MTAVRFWLRRFREKHRVVIDSLIVLVALTLFLFVLLHIFPGPSNILEEIKYE